MTAARRVAALAAALCLSAIDGGCLVGPVDDIPCGDDRECPTSYFCDLPDASCQAEGDDSGVPELVIGKLRDPSGALVILPKVPESSTVTIGVQILNKGKSPAGDVGLSFAPLECTAWRVPVENLPAEVPGEGAVEVAAELTTGGDDCGGVKIVDWFLAFSGRERRGTFDLDILDP